MNRTELIFLNLLNLAPKKTAEIIANVARSGESNQATITDWKKLPFFCDEEIKKIISAQRSGILDEEMKLIEKHNITIIDIFDKQYPQLLKEIDDPPVVLYIKGNPEVLSNYSLAIVGTRHPTHYGVSLAEKFSAELAKLGLTIISGLAKGIDTAAHKGTLKCGVPAAVLGSGIMNIYPRENAELAKKIIEKGALISEFPMKTKPLKENFPRRNRIVSGISRGVLVIEAAERSGALITARMALEQNREVFAVPGKIDSPVSKGTHKLIKQGAKLIDSVEDILEELNINVYNINLAEKKD